MERYRPTQMTIDRGILAENVRALMRRLAPGARMMAVVKADAYGHGIVTEAQIALKNGAVALAVAIPEEGVALREAGVRAPILILGGVNEAGARAAVDYNLSQALYDRDTLRVMNDQAKKRDTVAHAHLKIDTGMSRVGLLGDAELTEMLDLLKSARNVKCEGVFTHFCVADSDPEFTRLQNSRFREAVLKVRAAGFKPIAHASASSGFLLDSTLHYDMVRPGIALYGAEFRHLCPELAPAQRLTTRPVRLEWIEEGDTVGYGRTFTARRKTRVMTLPIGYGDGYPRLLSGKAPVLVKGRRAPQIGRVCMDMMMADVTDVPGVTLEDEVVLLGAQGEERITPDELAALSGTIPYEIMLGFSSRVPRVTV